MTTRAPRSRSLAEWVTLSLSVVVVGALIAVALIEESRRQVDDGAPVEVIFDTEHTESSDGSYFVPYTIRNTGPNAIASAEIWIEVYDAAQLAEETEIIVQFLHLQGEQDGLFVTAHDPATHIFTARLESVLLP